MSSPILSHSEQEQNNALVRRYISCIGNKRYDDLEAYLHPNFEFNGPITLRSAADYIGMLRDHSKHIAGVEVKALFVDSGDCCIIYDLMMDTKIGAVACLEWLTIKDGRISATRLHFDRLAMMEVCREASKNLSR